MKRHLNTERRALVVATVLSLGVVGGCGADPSTHVVTATDFAYDGLPERIDSGDRLELRNESDAEVHEFVAFRIPDGDDRPIDEIAALAPDELMALIGPEPAAVLLTPPGGEMIVAVGSAQFDDPGRYGVVCVIPTGVEPQVYLEAAATSSGGPPDVAGGPPHIAHGMYAEFVVDD